jgi:hypothetical protein
MARTTNGTLELKNLPTPDGYMGLHTNAYLNPDRQDVRDIVSAINDELVDEMSFAFMLEDGEWNDDYSEFRITVADINRGDVSAVNYGANPFTSITARAADWLEDARHMPAPVARAALAAFVDRDDNKSIFDESAEELVKRAERIYQTGARMNRDAAERNETPPAQAEREAQTTFASSLSLWKSRGYAVPGK